MKKMKESWQRWAETSGYQVSFGVIGMVERARHILEELRSNNMVDETFYKEWLSGFKYIQGLNIESIKTLVLVAIPKAAYSMDFIYRGNSGSAIFPPTYVHYRQTFKKIQKEASAAFGQANHSVELIDAPLKTLAVLTGLAKYGRNNVVYIPELGSYFQLVGLGTDMVIDAEDSVGTSTIHDNLMPQCKDCSACLNACPTGAINKDRILLHAEKCYTPLSEKPGVLPGTPLPPSRDCIIGCLKCQNICPMNKGKLQYKTTPFSLSNEETSFIVDHFNTNAPIWNKICQKFAQLQLTEGFEIFARNFQRLVKLSFR